MPDPMLQRFAREQADQAREQEQLRIVAQGLAMALQMMPAAQIVEIAGEPTIVHLERATEEIIGGITLGIRAQGAQTAYKVHLRGDLIDQLHELLHSDAPVVEEPDPAGAAAP